MKKTLAGLLAAFGLAAFVAQAAPNIPMQGAPATAKLKNGMVVHDANRAIGSPQINISAKTGVGGELKKMATAKDEGARLRGSALAIADQDAATNLLINTHTASASPGMSPLDRDLHVGHIGRTMLASATIQVDNGAGGIYLITSGANDLRPDKAWVLPALWRHGPAQTSTFTAPQVGT